MYNLSYVTESHSEVSHQPFTVGVGTLGHPLDPHTSVATISPTPSYSSVNSIPTLAGEKDDAMRLQIE